MPDPASRPILLNRRGRRRFEILQEFEAGLVLTGTEAKALREGKGSIEEAFARVKRGQVDLIGMNLPPYSHDGAPANEPDRPRRCLLHKWEIRRIEAELGRKGLTLIPLEVSFKGPWAKVRLGLARGLKIHDVRAKQAEREARRSIEQATRRRR
mgnify:CR=1 FL=1